jgi:hypothetical protein
MNQVVLLPSTPVSARAGLAADLQTRDLRRRARAGLTARIIIAPMSRAAAGETARRISSASSGAGLAVGVTIFSTT